MTSMKIERWKTAADTFTWPNNPDDVNIPGVSNHETTSYGPVNLNMVVASEGIRSRTITLTGHLKGDSRLTNYRSMAKKFRQTTRMHKLFWESDKFYLGIGNSVTQTNTSGQTNFISYVAVFEAVIGLLFEDTLNSSGTNDGNATTYIEEIVATYDGSGDLSWADNHGTTVTIDSGEFSGTEDVLYLLVWPVDTGDGIYMTEYGWVGIEVDSGTTSSASTDKLIESGQNFETTVSAGDVVKNTTDNTFSSVESVDSDTQLTLRDDIMASSETYTIFSQSNAVTKDGHGRLRLTAGENVSNITATNTSSSTEYFRDAWYE